ncbi:MAG: methylation-associated defense system protein kinase MAD6, partial [Gemmataceae bacterium]
RLDRALDFLSPAEDRSLFNFEHRGTYDREILHRMFDDLPRDVSGNPGAFRTEAHQQYVSLFRRRSFFERRDTGWKAMLPYRSANRILAIIRGEELPADLVREVLDGINRGEGLTNPRLLKGRLALQVREVENGSIRSYRLFPAERFSLHLQDDGVRARFVEHLPSGLLLR